MQSRRFRVVRNGLPILVDMAFDADVFLHLRAARDAMRVTFGTLENKIDEVADLDDLAGLTNDEATETAGDAE